MTTPYHPARRLSAALGALLLLAALTGCGGSAGDAEPEKRAFALTGDRLTITKNNGDLDVRPADIDRVEVTRWFSGRSRIGSPEATWNLAGEELILTTKCGAIGGTCDVRYQLLVPKDVALTIDGDNGKVSASGFDTALRIRSDNGAVSVDNASGDLTLNSDNGQLRATGTTSGRVDAGSQNGEIHLSFTAIPDHVGSDDGERRGDTRRAARHVQGHDHDGARRCTRRRAQGREQPPHAHSPDRQRTDHTSHRRLAVSTNVARFGERDAD